MLTGTNHLCRLLKPATLFILPGMEDFVDTFEYYPLHVVWGADQEVQELQLR